MRDREFEPLQLSKVLGIPKKGIIFSDLDGVWFDEQNNFASPRPEDLTIIEEAKNAGYWVVLNSDTGSVPLARFAEELNCSPLVIGENGMVIYAPNAGIKDFFRPEKPLFDELRQDAIAILSADRKDSVVTLGDATRAIKEDQNLPYPNSIVYLINTMRECSFGMYVRRTDEAGKMTIDENALRAAEMVLDNAVSNIINKWKSVNVMLATKSYPTVGSYLVRDPRVYKARGVEKVIQQFPPTLDYYMIGDSDADAMDFLGGRVTTCAVGNATNRLKEIAKRSRGIVAPDNLTLTKGANYVIKEILLRG